MYLSHFANSVKTSIIQRFVCQLAVSERGAFGLYMQRFVITYTELCYVVLYTVFIFKQQVTVFIFKQQVTLMKAAELFGTVLLSLVFVLFQIDETNSSHLACYYSLCIIM